jgi:hypothetical protein
LFDRTLKTIARLAHAAKAGRYDHNLWHKINFGWSISSRSQDDAISESAAAFSRFASRVRSWAAGQIKTIRVGHAKTHAPDSMNQT